MLLAMIFAQKKVSMQTPLILHCLTFMTMVIPNCYNQTLHCRNRSHHRNRLL